MAVSTIDRVREAELRSNEKEEAAELQAQKIVAEAQDRAAAIVAEAKQKAAVFDAKAVEEAQKRSDEIVQTRKNAAQAEASALTEKTLHSKQILINKLIQETLG